MNVSRIILIQLQLNQQLSVLNYQQIFLTPEPNKCLQLRNRKKILIVGSDGVMGKYLYENLDRNYYDLKKTTMRMNLVNAATHFLDLLDINSIDNLDIDGFDVALFFASKTNMQECEDNFEEAYQVNVVSTLKLIRKLSEVNCSVIFPSTSLVFGGKKPYPGVHDELDPAGTYANFKKEVEENLFDINPNKITILRISKIIDYNFPLFFDWKVKLLKDEEVEPFNDLIFSPISICFLSKVIVQIIKKNFSGILNVSAKSDISYADAARYMSNKLGLSLDKIKSKSAKGILADFHLPKFASMDSSSLNSLGLEAPHPYKSVDFFLRSNSYN